MLKDFKEFATRGNVLELAVAVVLGAAFGRVVTSFVEDVLMPPLGLLLRGVDFSNLFLDLSGTGHTTLAQAKAAGAPVIAYGAFLNAVVTFLLVAFAVFLLVRQVNRLVSKPAPATKECPECASNVPIKAKRCAHCQVAFAG